MSETTTRRPSQTEKATMTKIETAEAHVCKHDGKPCYVGKDTDDAHWRCGTVQCSGTTKGDNSAYYLSLAVRLLADALTIPHNATDAAWREAARVAILGTEQWMQSNAR